MNRQMLIKRAIVVLNFSKVIYKLILQAKAIAAAMQSAPIFAALAPKIAELVANIQNLEDIIAALNVKNPLVSIEMREAGRTMIKDNLRTLRMDVQRIADQDKENAPAIIKSACMQMKLVAVRGPQPNTASNGKEEGSVILSSATTGPHDWTISTNGTDFNYLSSSRDSKTTVYNLTSGVIYYFRNRQVLSFNQKGDWSPIMQFRVR